MTLLILGLVLFLGAHSTRIVADGWRAQMLQRLGEKLWKGLYSLASIVGFVVLIYGYGLARQAPVVLYAPPTWTRHLAAALMIPAFVLLAAAYVPGTRIKRAVGGHPMLVGVKTWAVAHLLANGTLHDVVLFGAFLAWAVVDYVACRRRDRAEGRVYIAGPVQRDATAVTVGVVAWAVFAFWLHGWLIGVRPFG
jgi:uncharacterized membrane protein